MSISSSNIKSPVPSSNKEFLLDPQRISHINDDVPPQSCKTPEPELMLSSHKGNHHHGHHHTHHHHNNNNNTHETPETPHLVRRSSSNYVSALINDSLSRRSSTEDKILSQASPQDYYSEQQNLSTNDNFLPLTASNHWTPEDSKHIIQKSSIGFDQSRDLSTYNFNIDYTQNKEISPSTETFCETKSTDQIGRSYHSNQVDKTRTSTNGDISYSHLKQREQQYHIAANNDFLT